MNDELWSCPKVIEYLGVTLNNLRQMQHRGAIKWVQKIGKEVYYQAEDVKAYKKKRDDRNSE